MDRRYDNPDRYARQTVFPELGPVGQRKLTESSVTILGVGGLGSWSAELLARAGVGHLRLIDDDRVETTNLHRQAMYDEPDAEAEKLKVDAAAAKLVRMNREIHVETVSERVDASNIAKAIGTPDLIMDGTDNFATRFVLNDYAVKHSIPWVFGGVVRGEGQVMSILPGRSPCLRCFQETPPPAGTEPRAVTAGVLGPAVAAISAIQAAQTIRILTKSVDIPAGRMILLDVWNLTARTMDMQAACRDVNCVCCQQKRFEFLSDAS
ncbi:MAG: HesA/MoeB/ThiF family protein [Phycisphaerae bacterium]